MSRRACVRSRRAANPISMAALTQMVDVSQIVFGTDYPYRTGIDHVKGLSTIFNAAELRIRKVLADAHMGLQIYLAGTETVIGLAQRAEIRGDVAREA